MRFFIRACFSKLEARFNAFKKMYPPSVLEQWSPTPNEQLSFSQVTMTHPEVQPLLVNVRISGDQFALSKDNASLWWQALTLLLLTMGEFIRTYRGDETGIDKVAAASEALHSFLSEIPSTFWRLPSLAAHIQNCRSPTPVQDDEEQTDEALGNDQLKTEQDIKVPPEVRAFYRGLDSVCAWTTGSRYILSSGITKLKAPLTFTIVDLPRDDVTVRSPEALAARWKDKRQWDSDMHTAAITTLESFQADVKTKAASATAASTPEDAVDVAIPSTLRACHCEAGSHSINLPQTTGFETRSR
ncbi:hypothetical protein C8R45DRAFT_88818 [Mycena sanguinolenta]|nr:hypothetical protein C8R45DRAFT_88818 [Mycena sanguinolenta]